MNLQALAKIGSVAVAVSVLAGVGSGRASAVSTSLPQISAGRVILDFQPPHNQAQALAAGSTSVKRLTRTVSDGGTSFHVTMVGKNPCVVQTAPSTTVKTFLVPVKIILPNGDTFDPMATTPCVTQASALARTVQSPVVATRAYSLGGRALGTGQYTDIFRRAEFFTQTSPTGINPGYHVKLDTATLTALTVRVPASAAAEFGAATPCGEKTGAFEINWWDSFLTSTLLPSLRAQGVTETTLPIFLLRDVVSFDTVTSNCCILGYHSFTSTALGRQTYAVGDYESSGRFIGSSDISP